ncbi:MAG: helix-hairpin-helix domain-containing protein [Clostridium sp.]|nr:helix-hairpin-helix domain-containing protein [Clostridium sp.]
MKDHKKKILTAAAFLIAAGLVFGLTGSRDSARELDDTGAIVMNSSGNREPGEQAEDENISAPENNTPEDRRDVENSEKSSVYVYICGEVIKPGVYELSGDSRIYEAVDAAGGFTENAARECVNLASKVSDGMQITIYNREEAASLLADSAPVGENAGKSGTSGSGLVNLNTATKEELMTLKGIGESKAEDIIRYREKSGGFKKIEDIMKISGIKENGFQKIKDSITV